MQDLIGAGKDRVWSLIEHGAVIFVCGDGGRMEPYVERRLMEIYRAKTNAGENAAARWIDEMGTQNRYVLDVWAGN